MEKKDPTNLSLAIGKNDTDIMNWFNMIEKSGQSRSRWVGALLVAYVNGETVNTGNCFHTPLSELPPIAEKADSDTTPFALKKPKAKSYGWGCRDINGEFTVGSSVFIKLSNKKTISALKSVKAGEVPISYVVRAMIRRGFSGGDTVVCPDGQNIEKYYNKDFVQHYEELINQQLNSSTLTTPATTSKQREDLSTICPSAPDLLAKHQDNNSLAEPILSPEGLNSSKNQMNELISSSNNSTQPLHSKEEVLSEEHPHTQSPEDHEESSEEEGELNPFLSFI